jgi:hypothetical protein
MAFLTDEVHYKLPLWNALPASPCTHHESFEASDFGLCRESDSMANAVRHLLPRSRFDVPEPIPSKRVSLVAVKLRYLIEQLVSVEIKVPPDSAAPF